MKLLDVIFRRNGHEQPPTPPDPGRDPDLVDHAITTARVLSKVDRAVERRHRLNLELAKAEDAIRSAPRAHPGRPS